MTGPTSGPVGPPAEQYDDVLAERVDITSRDGTPVACLRFSPTGDGPFPAVVIGAEATGINGFIRRVGASLAHGGFVVVIPDYYRGAGPPDPEAYEDVDTLMRHIDGLDFRRAINVIVDAVGEVRRLASVDADDVSVWGYCTGATLALFAAELDPQVRAAVLFFPSQPTFGSLDDTKPSHAIDLLWSIRGRVQLHYGDADVVMPAELLDEIRRRCAAWHVDTEIVVYPGAGHAFCAEVPMFFDESAARTSWDRALAFLADRRGAS